MFGDNMIIPIIVGLAIALVVYCLIREARFINKEAYAIKKTTEQIKAAQLKQKGLDLQKEADIIIDKVEKESIAYEKKREAIEQN